MAILIPVTVFLGAVAILILALLVVCAAGFFAVTIVFSQEKSGIYVYEILIIAEFTSFQWVLASAGGAIISQAIQANQQVILNAATSSFLTVGLAILTAGGVLVLAWQDSLTEGWLVLNQCGIAALRDKFVFQVMNTLALTYDIFQPFWVMIVRIEATFIFVPLEVLAGCTDESIFEDTLQELGLALQAFVFSFVEVLESPSPIDEPLDLAPFMYHLGNAVNDLLPVFVCFCSFFDFVWIPVLAIPSFMSVNVEVDCAANVIFAFLQMIARPFAYGGSFTVLPWAEEVTCTWLALGDIQQDILLQLVQLFTGAIAEVLSPCELFNTDPTACIVSGHCAFDTHLGICRDITICDAQVTRNTCEEQPICCWDAYVNRTLNGVSTVNYTCDTSFADTPAETCPNNGNAGCVDIPTVENCTSYNGVCLWNNTADLCFSNDAMCANYTDDTSCREIPTFCGAFTSEVPCTTQSNELCMWTGSCISWAEACFASTPSDANTTCAPLQLCGWNYNQSKCLPFDTNVTLSAASISEASVSYDNTGQVTEALHVPGPDSPAGTIDQLIGVPILLEALEVQWAHAGFFIGNELFAFIFNVIMNIIQVLIDSPTVFTQYDGLVALRLGFLFNFLRSWVAPIADVSVVIDVDLPCTLENLVIIPVDVAQGLTELFFLTIFFPIFQPTGPAASIHLWSPFDYLASYWNDTLISFEPLILINGSAYTPEQWAPGAPVNTFATECPTSSYTPACKIIINPDTAIVIVNGVTYNVPYPYVASITVDGTTIELVDIFPGIDKTLPQIIVDIESSSLCLERFIGDGTNNGETTVPWACAVRHFVNVFAELLNIGGQLIFYIADIIRFTDDPPYRRDTRDIYVRGFFDEWTAMAECIGNIIRLFQPNNLTSGLGRCVNISESTFQSEQIQSFPCCLANFTELILAGAILATIQETLLFAQDLFALPFIIADGDPFYLPDLTTILNDIDATTGALACVISEIIPPSFSCPLNIDPSLICTEFDGVQFFNAPCVAEVGCGSGSGCLTNFLAALFLIPTTPFRIVDLFYSQIRGVVSSQCTSLMTKLECDNNSPPCLWDSGSNKCLTDSSSTNVLDNSDASQQALDIITLIVTMISIPLGVLMRIGFTFALLIDCITCAISFANSGDSTPCTTTTDVNGGQSPPVFAFAYGVLEFLYGFLTTGLKVIVSVVVLLFLLIVGIVTGNFATFDATFTIVLGQIGMALGTLFTNIFLGVIDLLGLRNIYTGLINIINTVLYKACEFLGDIVNAINGVCGNCLGSPPSCSASLLPGFPPPGSSTIPESQCGVITVQTFCSTIPGCSWNGTACAPTAGCALGNLNRQACTQIGQQAGGVDQCFWRVSVNVSTDATLRYQGCFNSSTASPPFPPCEADRVVSSLCDNCAANFSIYGNETGNPPNETCSTWGTCNATACISADVCGYTPFTIGPDSLQIPVNACSPVYSMCNTSNCGCRTFDGNQAGCGDWAGVCFWLPLTSECVNSYSLCARPNHTLVNEAATNVTTLIKSLYGFTVVNLTYGAGGEIVSNNFCSLGLDLCFPYTNSGACNGAATQNLCTWVTNITASDFYNTSAVFNTSRNIDAIGTSITVNGGACVSTYGAAVLTQQPLSTMYFSCVPLPSSNYTYTAPDTTLCLPIDAAENFLAPSATTPAYLESLTEPMRRKRAADSALAHLMVNEEQHEQPAPSPTQPTPTLSSVWAPDDECSQYGLLNQSELLELINNTILSLVGTGNGGTGGTFDAFGSQMYCVGRVLWLFNISGATVPDPTQADFGAVEKLMGADCDVLFTEYYNVTSPGVSWSTLRPFERVHLTECVKWRLLGEFVRSQSNYTWLPADIFYNSLRKWQLFIAAAEGYSVYQQYQLDRSTTPATVLSASYAAGVAQRGIVDPVLINPFVTDPNTLADALADYTLYDYFMANDLSDNDYAMTIDLVALMSHIKNITTQSLTTSFAGLLLNTSSPLSLVKLLVNGTAVDLQQITTSAALSAISGTLNMTALVLSTATNPVVYKRALGASVQIGNLIYNGIGVLRKWLTSNSTFVQKASAAVSTAAGTTYAATTASVSSAMAPVATRWANRVRAAYAVVWRNPSAAIRRTKLQMFGAQLNYSFHNIFVANLRNDTKAYQAALFANAPAFVQATINATVRDSGLIPQATCITNTSNLGTNWFCENCLTADGILGRIYYIVLWVADYFSGDDPSKYYVSFPNSYARFKAYAAYAATDSAPVQVGGSLLNPVFWPYAPSINISNWAPLGDATPNKLRFYDYGALFTALFDAAESASANPQGLLIVQLIDSALNSLFVITAVPVFNAVASAVSMVFAMGGPVVAAMAPKPYVVVANTTADPGTIFIEILSLFYTNNILCSFPLGIGGGIDGRNKRFAIGEIFGIAALTVMAVVPFVMAASAAGTLTVVSAMMGITMLFVFIFAFVTYNYAFLCSPALPQGLADDVRDFVGYTLLPKCPWFAIGTLRENYTNTNCYSCTVAKTYTSSSCVKDWHFYTIFDNLAFTTVAMWPALPSTLSQLGLGALVNGTFFANLINKWEATYVPSDLHNFAALWICNAFWTLWPQIFITGLAIQLLVISAPYFYVVTTVIYEAWAILYAALLIIYVCTLYIFVLAESVPFMMAYGVTTESVLSGQSYAAGAAYGSVLPLTTAIAAALRAAPASSSTLGVLWRETRKAIGNSALGYAVQTLRRRAHGHAAEEADDTPAPIDSDSVRLANAENELRRLHQAAFSSMV